jgi:hypothetical protein
VTRRAVASEVKPDALGARSGNVETHRLAFLDFEASSISSESYPIEVGWVFEDGSGEGFLIRPEPGWTDWSTGAQAIHGIARATLLREGVPAMVAAERALQALRNRLVVSDAPSAEQLWLDRLAEAVGIPRIAEVRHYYSALNTVCSPLNGLFTRGSPGCATGRALLRETASRLVLRAHNEEQARGLMRHRALDDARSLWRIWSSVNTSVGCILERSRQQQGGCQVAISSSTASVTALTKSGETSTP